MADNYRKGEWRKKRKEEYRDLRDAQFYIFCEGEKTEPNYFLAFKKSIEHSAIYKDMVHIEVEGCGKDPSGVLKAAKKYVKENNVTKGQVWCVYDKDDFTAENFDSVVREIKVLNKNNGDLQYFAAWSNQCIEIWFLLHFCDYVADNQRKEYIKSLNDVMKRWNKKYIKNDEEIYGFLLEHGNPKQAIKFAKRKMDGEEGKLPSQIAPATNVFALVEEMAKYLPDEQRDKFL